MKKLPLVLLILALAQLVTLPPAQAVTSPTASVTTITTTGENLQFGFQMGGSESFYAQGRYWLFFVDGFSPCEGGVNGDCIEFTSSTDGTSWSALTVLNLNAQDPNFSGDYSVITNSSAVFLARCNCTLLGSKDNVVFQSGTLSAGGTISWQSQVVVKTNSSIGEDFYGLAITQSTTGRIFIAYNDCNPGCNGSGTHQSSGHVINADAPYSSWSGDTQFICDSSNGNCPANQNSYIRNILIKQTGGKVHLITATGAIGIKGYQYDGASWGAQQTASNGNLNPNCAGFSQLFKAISIGGDQIAMIWPASANDNMCFNTYQNGAWGQPNNIPGSRVCNTAPRYSCYDFAFEPGTQTYYMFVFNQGIRQIQLYYGTQVSNFNLINIWPTGTAGSTINFLRSAPGAITIGTGWTIPFWYTDNSAGPPFNLNYGVLVGPVAGQSSTPPQNNIQAQNNFAFNTTNFKLGNLNLTIPIQLATAQALTLLFVFPLAALATSEILVAEQRRKLSNLDRLVIASSITATLTVGFDYTFHFSITSPMEIPFYFIAKLAVAFAVAFFLVPRLGSIVSAAIFTFSFDVYYGVGVLLLHIPGLSSSPTQIIEIAGFGSQCLGYNGCDLVTEGVLLVLWTVAHGLFFLVAAEISYRIPTLLRPKTGKSRSSLV